MSKVYVTILGKTIRRVARLRGSGSALPGLVVEQIDPDFIKDTLSHLPRGIVVISGTNGKTTTAKMVVALLESQGLRVFTNRTGSNFTRGVAAALLADVDIKGKLHADIAVLELDEAHATHFVNTIKPRYSLILNVLRDQLDRFGEIDHTTQLLRHIVQATTTTVVLNRQDARIADLAKDTNKKVLYFGLSRSLVDTFPSDDDMHSHSTQPTTVRPATVTLDSFKDTTATFTYNNFPITTPLKLTGIYNVYNAAAALALVDAVIEEDVNITTLTKALSQVTPAFGRGERFIINNQSLELVLVKNPSGFRLGLQSFDPTGQAIMIAINDNYADGRDMSWLWDVDFGSLARNGVAQVSGIRAYDMALRLQYDEVAINSVQPNLQKALRQFIKNYPDEPKRIYCTYTAMLTLRRELGKITHVEHIG